MQYSWTHRTFLTEMVEPMFALCTRLDYVYIDQNFTKFSTRRVDDTYRTF